MAALVHAFDDVTLQLQAVTGEGWRADGISVDLDLPAQTASAQVARLRVDALDREFKDLKIACKRVDLSGEVIACAQASVLADWPGIGRQAIAASIRYGRRDGSLDVTLDNARIGSGTATVTASLNRAQWNASAKLRRVSAEQLLRAASELRVPLPPISATGSITADIRVRGAQTDVAEVSAEATFAELTANNGAGSIATDKLAAGAKVHATRRGDVWEFAVDVSGEQGQAYFEPIFLDIGAHAVGAEVRGRLRSAQHLTIEEFSIRHAAVLDARGSATVDFAQEQPVRDLHVQVDSLQFPGAYESYLQPLLVDTSFGALQTAGSVTAALTMQDGAPRQIDVRLSDVTFDDGRAKFTLNELGGEWHWRAEAEDSHRERALSLSLPGGAGEGTQSAPAEQSADAANEQSTPAADIPASHLRWNDGALFGLDLGAAEFAFRTSGRQLRLLEPARIPILDGAIDIESFRIRNAGLPSVAFMVDATIEPIDVQGLCRAFGWPEFGGRIGGVISKLRMRDGLLTLGTKLQAQVFDGSVSISDLRLEQPLGKWPRLYSSLALEDLDLQLVTGAFSFGRITGRLSGAIDGLQLFNWTPVAFDARLYTPANDRSRHRISQRAVESIGSIGGGGAGVTAALSSGLLRFFEEFNYERLGISCRLENDVCLMDGVAPAPNGGYYLVKGKGLPRIDVIGSSRRVDWPRLVQQLAAATRSSGPVVD